MNDLHLGVDEEDYKKTNLYREEIRHWKAQAFAVVVWWQTCKKVSDV